MCFVSFRFLHLKLYSLQLTDTFLRFLFYFHSAVSFLVCIAKRRRMQPRRSYTFLSHGRPQQQIKSDFMPTTVAQFDHDARVIVIPINAKNIQCSKACTHTNSLTHAAITETYAEEHECHNGI